MKYLITESKMQEIALKWMDKNFSPDQLEIVKSPKYPDSIFYRKNGKVVMEQDLKNEYFYFHYEEIWSFFESFFAMEYTEIETIMKVWLENTLNLEGYTPLTDSPLYQQLLENTLNLEGYTPGTLKSLLQDSWKTLSI